jgi:ATPase subunit of ABC transporter with duplicated ATPase domains
MLARLLLSEPNLLLLDEPTNHLDIGMLEWLEDWLGSFPGAALIVSHDRAFLDNTVTASWTSIPKRIACTNTPATTATISAVPGCP